MKLTNKWTNRRSWQDTVPGARWKYIILALKVALNSALISASCFTALTETTFAPNPEVALRVYCVAVRSAILATAWLLVNTVTRQFTQYLTYPHDRTVRNITSFTADTPYIQPRWLAGTTKDFLAILSSKSPSLYAMKTVGVKIRREVPWYRVHANHRRTIRYDTIR